MGWWMDMETRRKTEVRRNQAAPLRTPYIRIVDIWQIWREREKREHEKSKDRPPSTGENKIIYEGKDN